MIHRCVNYSLRRPNISVSVYNCHFYRKRYKPAATLYEWRTVPDYLSDEFNHGNNNKFFKGWQSIPKTYDRYVHAYDFMQSRL